MPSTYDDVGQNARRVQESSNFGTRKLAFYTFVCDQEYNMVGEATQGGYSFRVNTVTGAVTFDADITARSVVDMYEEYNGNYDEDALQLTLPWTLNFVNNFENTDIYVNSNGGIVFGDSSAYYGSDYTAGDTGAPVIFIANNDGQVLYVYSETTGTSGSRQYRVKVQGNTDYNVDSINMVYEAVFYEDQSYIDFLVTQQPTDWNDYNDNQSDVYWGVTDGSNWVDGLSDHNQSFAPMGVETPGTNWKEQNSLFYRIVQRLQYAGVELFWLGQPHRTDETFVNDWSGLAPVQAEAFTFAIADDASSPQLYNEFTESWTIIETDTDGWVNVDGASPGWQLGQRVKFSGDVFGGIVAGKIYYIKDQDGSWFQISDTADLTNNDGTADYPVGFGYPGDPAVLTPDTGTMTLVQYWDDVVWDGTAGDVLWACCNHVDYKWVNATRLEDFLGDIEELDNGSWWYVDRSQATFGIFPAGYVGGL